MGAVQRTLQNIAVQLRRLNTTSRLLIGSMVIILLMALFIVGIYSGRYTMVPLPLNVGADSQAGVVSYLESRGIRWDQRGGEIVVPVEKRHLVLAELTENEVISPEQINFDALVQESSPFLSKAQNDRRWLVATMNQLSRTISRMKGINGAEVVIDEPDGSGGIGRTHKQPSASVTVETAGGLGQAQVDAIANMVAGAHAELKPTRVAVIDATTGRLHRPSTDDDISSGKYMDLVKEHTRHYEDKIMRHLGGFIPGVMVAVNVVVDHTVRNEKAQSYEEPKQGVTRERTKAFNAQNQPSSAEPGVRSNTGASAVSGGRVSTVSDERSDTSLEPRFGERDLVTHDPGGYAIKVNASIGVPRSYFVELFRKQSGDDQAEPDDATLTPIVQPQLTQIRGLVQPLVDTGPNGGPDQGTVEVQMIPDFVAAALGSAGGAGGGMGVTGFGGSGVAAGGRLGGGSPLVKYASLGGLALASLIMMFLMVKKATVRQELPSAAELVGVPPLPPVLEGSEPEVVGEAEAATVPMVGVEVDEAALRREEMLTQINEMAMKSPAEAAKLIRRWTRNEI